MHCNFPHNFAQLFGCLSVFVLYFFAVANNIKNGQTKDTPTLTGNTAFCRTLQRQNGQQQSGLSFVGQPVYCCVQAIARAIAIAVSVLVVVIYCVNNKVSAIPPWLYFFAFVLPPHLHIFSATF